MLFNAAPTALFAASLLLGPPPTTVEPVVDQMHGVRIVDDYRWLEALESDSEAVRDWTTEQNQYTRRTLDGLPGRVALERRLGDLMTVASITAPVMRMNRYFYRERKGE